METIGRAPVFPSLAGRRGTSGDTDDRRSDGDLLCETVPLEWVDVVLKIPAKIAYLRAWRGVGHSRKPHVLQVPRFLV